MMEPGTRTDQVDFSASIPAARPPSDFANEVVGDELVLFDIETMHYHSLNQVAAAIWQACDGVSSVESIAATTGLPVEVVGATVAELGEAGLLQSPSNRWDSALTRRRATKLIAAGLAGAVGLPVIKSITAPDAAAAASIGQCQFGFSAGQWLCGVCDFFRCRCETVTAGGSGWCCVCGGQGLQAASGFSEQEFFDAVDKASRGESLTADNAVSTGEQAIPEEAAGDPYLGDADGNVDVNAIQTDSVEEAVETDDVPATDVPVDTSGADASADSGGSDSEAVETSSGSEEAPTEEANG